MSECSVLLFEPLCQRLQLSHLNFLAHLQLSHLSLSMLPHIGIFPSVHGYLDLSSLSQFTVILFERVSVLTGSGIVQPHNGCYLHAMSTSNLLQRRAGVHGRPQEATVHQAHMLLISPDNYHILYSHQSVLTCSTQGWARAGQYIGFT